MTLTFTFMLNEENHSVDWTDGMIVSTSDEMTRQIDTVLETYKFVPFMTATIMVPATLDDEQGAYGVITYAIEEIADFGGRKYPSVVVNQDQFDYLPEGQLSRFEDMDKAKQSFGGDRSAAARYAAQVRWGKRDPEFDPLSVKEVTSNEMEQYLDSLYPFPDDEDYPFTSGHEAAIKEYTDEGWAINGALRGQAQEGVVIRPYSTVGQMDSAFEAAEPLTKAIVLHRGLDLKSFTEDGKATIAFFDGMKVGQSFSDPAFGSTSASGKIGDEFGARSRIRMKIVVPEGSKVLPINTMIGMKHSYAGEKEVLLPRNTRMRLVKRQYGEWENISGEGLTLTFVVEPTGGVQKARERRFGSRSEAGQYAAQVRWGNRGQDTPAVDPTTIPERTSKQSIEILDAMYPEGGTAVFSADEMFGITNYQIAGKNINRKLREGKDQGVATIVDQSIEKSVPLSKDMVFHRGIDFAKDSQAEEALKMFSSMKVGDSFQDAGYTSTTTSRPLAQQWAGITGLRFEIVVAKGTKVLPMNQILGKKTLYRAENEILLPRKAKFKVFSITEEMNANGGRERPKTTKVIKVVLQ